MSLFEELFPDVRSEEEISVAAEKSRAASAEAKRRKQLRDRDRSTARRAEDPEGWRNYQRAWRAANPDRTRRLQREWKLRNPDKVLRSNLKSKYGITIEERDSILASQGGRCPICGATDPGSKLGWHVEHDHATKKVRSVSCHPCNVMLGYARDNPNILRAGAEYLERHK